LGYERRERLRIPGSRNRFLKSDSFFPRKLVDSNDYQKYKDYHVSVSMQHEGMKQNMHNHRHESVKMNPASQRFFVLEKKMIVT
jgi:hypothetical protein